MGGWGAMPHAPTLAGFGFVMGPSQFYALGSFRGAFAFNHAAITKARGHPIGQPWAAYFSRNVKKP